MVSLPIIEPLPSINHLLDTPVIVFLAEQANQPQNILCTHLSRCA